MLCINCFRKNILFWLKDVPVLFSPRIIVRGIYNWWQLKEKICAWEDSDKIYHKFIFNLYDIIRLSKRWFMKSVR